MRNIHWIVQENLIREETLKNVLSALENDHTSYERVKIIPFSDEVPEITKTDAFKVFYGSTTLVLNAYKVPSYREGIFFDETVYTMPNYMEQWGKHMLNFDSQILTFSQIVQGNFQSGDWFVRPINDDKSFSGQVMTFEDMVKLESTLADSNNPYLDTHTLVAISQPKEIAKEWRHFIVDKKVVSSSRYAEYGQSSKSAVDVPEDLIAFVEARCQEYTPHAIFVMDTALHENSYKIVECNCFNDTGFYNHDIQKIVREVNAYLRNTIQ